MTKGQFPTAKFQDIQTPFYYYDTELLRATLQAINDETRKHEGFCVHYAVKANPGMPVLKLLDSLGSCFDIASRYELDKVLSLGVSPDRLSLLP